MKTTRRQLFGLVGAALFSSAVPATKRQRVMSPQELQELHTWSCRVYLDGRKIAEEMTRHIDYKRLLLSGLELES
jgi:hypothetical protein